MDGEKYGFNRAAKVIHEGKEYRLQDRDYNSLTFNDWHHGSGPSSWLCAELVTKVRYKWAKLPRDKVMQFCATALCISISELEGALDFNANYLAIHDGSTPEQNHAFPKV